MDKQIYTKTPIYPIVLGKIGSAYSIQGWLKVFSATEKAENIFNYQPWFINQGDQWWQIEWENWKRHNHNLIVKIRNINIRETATLMVNHEIIIDASQLPDLDDSEFYWKDLIGCQVITINDYQLGKVIDLISTGSNDVLIVKKNLKYNANMQEQLIPFLYKEVIKNIDLATSVINVDWNPNY